MNWKKIIQKPKAYSLKLLIFRLRLLFFVQIKNPLFERGVVNDKKSFRLWALGFQLNIHLH